MRKTLLAITLFLSLFACDRNSNEIKLIVTSSYGDVYINEKREVYPGLQVRQTDVIRTENGKITIQSGTGALILVKEFSKIRIEELMPLSTRVGVTNGSLLIKVDKLKSKENFSVMTPTAIASVRGTTFFVYSDRQSTVINSVEGKVGVGKTKGTETIVEKKSIEISETQQHVVSETYVPNIAEVTDIVTLISVSPENFEKARDGEIKGLRDEAREKTKKVEREAIEIVKSPNFASTRNIEVIKSTIVFKNGERVRANVIYQTNDKLFILDETRNIREVEKGTVSSIEF